MKFTAVYPHLLHFCSLFFFSDLTEPLFSFRLDESEMANVSDPFSREAPTRKSMSEKRGMGASNDPHHIKLFQDIKHQRQTSGKWVFSRVAVDSLAKDL